MPNHITNVITASTAVIGLLKNAEGKPDFNCVIPQPDCLKDFNPHSGIISRARSAMGQLGKKADDSDIAKLIKDLEIQNAQRDLVTPIDSKDIESVARAILCFQETGFFYWYDWNIANWDTKWNAYSFDEKRSNDTVLVFETAWSMPKKVALALSAKIPDEKIVWKFADEDTGSNCGTVVIQNGEIVDMDVSPGWNELDDEGRRKWTKFAFELRYPGKDQREFGYDENFNSVED